MNTRQDIRFVAENTLGKLAKWLRILGFDTIYEREIVCKRSYDPKRIRLTRTQQIRHTPADTSVIFITSDHYLKQIKQVIKEVGISLDDIQPFSRCIRCNDSIWKVEKESVIGKVPDYIWETHDTFQTCPRCNRLYWPGSHISQSRERIERLFSD
jgi:uncharacterized protein with PIN domain